MWKEKERGMDETEISDKLESPSNQIMKIKAKLLRHCLLSHAFHDAMVPFWFTV